MSTARGRSPDAVWFAVVIVVALTYVVLFLAHLTANIHAVFWNSDYDLGFLVAQTVVEHGSGGHTLLSTTGAYLSLWFTLLTAWLPFHHQLWQTLPTLLFVLTSLVIGWSVAQVASLRTGSHGLVRGDLRIAVGTAHLHVTLTHHRVSRHGHHRLLPHLAAHNYDRHTSWRSAILLWPRSRWA